MALTFQLGRQEHEVVASALSEIKQPQVLAARRVVLDVISSGYVIDQQALAKKLKAKLAPVKSPK